MSDRDPTPPPYGRTVVGNDWTVLDGLTPAQPPRVTAIVTHYAQPTQLARTLAALARQTHPADRLEVIVVDDGSPDPPEVPAHVTLLRQPDSGFRAAAARNLGAAHATGEILCFLDADTTPEPEYVTRLTRLPSLAPEAVTVGRRRHAALSSPTADPHAPIERIAPPLELPAPAWLADGYAQTANLRDADDRAYRFVISAVLACSAWNFAEVGPFTDFDAYGGEDWEWAHRAWQSGAILAHVDDAVAWHDGPDWEGRAADDVTRRAAKNAETLRLADLITVAGSRGRAIRPTAPALAIILPEIESVAAAYLCVDSLLVALPEATVVVSDALAPTFEADPRVRVASPAQRTPAPVVLEVQRPTRVRNAAALRVAVKRVAAEGLASLELTAPDGRGLLRLSARRGVLRAGRWGAEAEVATRHETVDWLEPIEGDPDLEAYLGGWG